MDKRIKISGSDGKIIMRIVDEEKTLTATMDKIAAVRLAGEILHAVFHEGFAPLVISERLGHESIQTTLDRYGHLYPSKQSEIAARLEGFAP